MPELARVVWELLRRTASHPTQCNMHAASHFSLHCCRIAHASSQGVLLQSPTTCSRRLSPCVQGEGTVCKASHDCNVQGQVSHAALGILHPAVGRDGIPDVSQAKRRGCTEVIAAIVLQCAQIRQTGFRSVRQASTCFDNVAQSVLPL